MRRGEWASRNAAYAEVDADPDDEDTLFRGNRSISAESNSDSKDRARAIGVEGAANWTLERGCVEDDDAANFSDKMRFCNRISSFSNTWYKSVLILFGEGFADTSTASRRVVPCLTERA